MDKEQGKWLAPDEEGKVAITVDSCFYGMVSTAVAISDTYADEGYKPADVIAFLLTSGGKNLEKQASPELMELINSDAFQKYSTHLYANVLPGKETSQIIESVNASEIQGIMR